MRMPELLRGAFPTARLLIATILSLPLAASAADRAALSLDGAWQFRMDPNETGRQEAWFSPGAGFDATIHVPGAWEAQGFGEETPKLHHHFIGKGWYKRQVSIPADWAGRSVFVCIGGVHRYAGVWVDESYLGEHVGYLSPFEYDITEQVSPGSSVTLTLCVDSKQRWEVDTLTGCFDIIDYMDTYWGGIWGHVRLEARSASYLEDLFVEPHVDPPGCRVSATLQGGSAGQVCLSVMDPDGVKVVEQTASIDAALSGETLSVNATIPDGHLWTPKAPCLYTARLSLVRDGRTIDHLETRVGLREITIEGPHLLLNGKRVFLHGYGDDCVYPETMAAPSDKDVYLKRLRVAKEYGFNHVRHHSHLLPPEYYDACDEAGMLVSAEFPIAYQRFYDQAGDAAMDLYRKEWTAAIKRFRNHPSIVDWCMGNEMWNGVPLAPELYAMAKELDPTRPVVDSDGITARGFLDGTHDRDTLDLYFFMFDIFNTPFDNPGKFDCPAPGKPVISHETGNYVTFPRLDLIDEFTHNFKPFWLTEARGKLAGIGLLTEAEQWAGNSERLYHLCHKTNTEALRRNPNLSGHHWWLLQDYWTTTNGLVDAYFRPKPAIAPERVRQFNADTVLLQDGLALTYRGGERLDVSILVSHFAESELPSPTLSCRVSLGGTLEHARTETTPDVGQGEVAKLADLSLTLPEVQEPAQVRIEAELSREGFRITNDWTAWVYPPSTRRRGTEVPVFASSDMAPRFGLDVIPTEDPLPSRAVYVTQLPTVRVVDAMAAGACLVLLQPPVLFPAVPTRFKTAWWHGNAKDNNCGTVVYDHPATRAMAPEGWCDASWYRLVEASHGYLLDALPGTVNVLVRGIEVPSVCRDKALLFEAKCGEGSVIVCGLNLDVSEPGPEAEWLTAQLIEYAATLPKPAAELPLVYLRDRVGELPQFPEPFLEGFARVVRNEGEEGVWFSYREQDAPHIACRQTQLGNRIEWETAAVPADFQGEAVTFVFAGGAGWISQPETEGFAFSVNGEEVLSLDVTNRPATWRNEERGIVLTLWSKRVTNEDNMGLFYMKVPSSYLHPGDPVRFAVHSRAAGSQRWFAVNPYTDVLSREKK